MLNQYLAHIVNYKYEKETLLPKPPGYLLKIIPFNFAHELEIGESCRMRM